MRVALALLLAISHVCHVLITVVGLHWQSVNNTGFCENQLQAILQFLFFKYHLLHHPVLLRTVLVNR